jgi:hypothetical protein
MRQHITIRFQSWLRPKLGAIRCAVLGEHRVRFVRMGSNAHFLEQCRWCWHAWDEAGRFVL